MIKDTGYKKIWGYRNGYGTNVGDIEVSIWTEAEKHLIAREKEESLFNQLLQWETEHNYSQSSKSALYAKPLELHVSRIFDDPAWVNFISFNQRYRPEILDQYPLICVITECCGKKGLTTNERIARTYEHCIPCPHCGKWSKYRVVEV